MSSSDRSVGCRSRRSGEQFREERLVRITLGAFAVGLDPFRMLDPKIIVNLLLELGVGVDFVIHGYCPGKIQVRRGTVPTRGSAETSTSLGAVSARYGQVSVFQREARLCLPCARRWVNRITSLRWRCSNTASIPLCVSVRVEVDFLITWFLSVFLVRRHCNLPRRGVRSGRIFRTINRFLSCESPTRKGANEPLTPALYSIPRNTSRRGTARPRLTPWLLLCYPAVFVTKISLHFSPVPTHRLD